MNPKSTNQLYYGEFDPGSGLTLAAGLIHASRGAAGCSNTSLATGARVRNTYAIYLQLGNSPPKGGLIPHNITRRHRLVIKPSGVEDEHASD